MKKVAEKASIKIEKLAKIRVNLIKRDEQKKSIN
jgi:hypothetical protein